MHHRTLDGTFPVMIFWPKDVILGVSDALQTAILRLSNETMPRLVVVPHKCFAATSVGVDRARGGAPVRRKSSSAAVPAHRTVRLRPRMYEVPSLSHLW